MITIKGKSVFGGVSIGKIMFYKRNEKVIKRTHVDDVDAEWKRFCDAKDTAVSQLKELYDKAIEDVGEANAMIFEIHQMMLEDLDYLESIENIIRTQEVNAEFAVATTADNFAQMFAAMDDAYMQGRAADVKDVSERVLDILCGVSGGMKEMTEPCIIAADDLAPSETVQLDKSKVLGFATMYGSSNSHTAILARTMNIPAVIGLGEDLLTKYDGKMAVIDGFTGMLYIDTDEEKMKVILIADVKGRGNKGQIIDVANGYGNYLLTNKLAIQATDENIKQVEAEKEKEKEDAENHYQLMLKLKSEIESKSINIFLQVGGDGKLFSHITTKRIADEFAAQTGITIDKRKISLPAEINSVGIFTAIVDLGKNVQATIEMNVLEK